MKTASFRFTSILSLMFHTCHFPSMSWWIVLQSHQDDEWVPSKNVNGKILIWLQDEADGKCLGPLGFGECGDTNLWQIWGAEGAYTLEHFVSISDNNEEALCLVAYSDFHPFDHTSEIGLTKCSKRSAVTWDFAFALGQLSHKKWSKQCLSRKGNKALTQSCDLGFAPLTTVLHDNNQLLSNADFHKYYDKKIKNKDTQLTTPQISSKTNNLTQPNTDEWMNTDTGLTFPNILSDKINLPWNKRQVIMGGGTYAQRVFNMLFKVYTVALYVEVEPASKSPALLKFNGQTSTQLLGTTDFFQTISSQPEDYDRTLFIKLAMSIKKDTLVQGLVKEMFLKPKNAEIFAQASRKYPKEECPRGLEIMIIWKKLRPSSTSSSTNSVVPVIDVLEIRIDNIVLDVLKEPGLAQDFFWQYLGTEPVSEDAKTGFVSNYPALIRGDYLHQKQPSDINNNNNQNTKQSSLSSSTTTTLKMSTNTQTTLSSATGTTSITSTSTIPAIVSTTSSPLASSTSTTATNNNDNNSNSHHPSHILFHKKSYQVTKILKKFSPNRFSKLKNQVVMEIFLSILITLYLCILFVLSLPAVSRRVKEVKVKVASAVKLVTSKSSGAISRMVSSTSNSSLPKRCSQYRFIVDY